MTNDKQDTRCRIWEQDINKFDPLRPPCPRAEAGEAGSEASEAGIRNPGPDLAYGLSRLIRARSARAGKSEFSPCGVIANSYLIAKW